MKLYADAPTRRTRQLLADVLFVLWIVGWVWVGHVVQHGTMELAGVGRQTDASATSLADGLTSAGDTLSGMPLVGGGSRRRSTRCRRRRRRSPRRAAPR